MCRAGRYVGTALACWAALAWVSAAPAQSRDRDRDEPRDERRAPQVEGRERRPAGDAPAERRAPEARRVKDVLGTKVSISGGLVIGTVDDIIFADDGYIDYLVVLNEGKYVLVPWEAAKFDFGKRAAAVDITQERFREVPTFTRDQWPQVYEPAYQQRVYTYYGLKPGQERRLERREGGRRR
jgi:hypothetical protein